MWYPTPGKWGLGAMPDNNRTNCRCGQGDLDAREYVYMSKHLVLLVLLLYIQGPKDDWLGNKIRVRENH